MGDPRPIAGVSTSVTGFVDFFAKGSLDGPTLITSFEEFTRHYGGLDARSEASYGIMQYFANGGRQAIVLRVFASGELDAGAARGTATATLFASTGDDASDPRLFVDALNPGAWGNEVQVGIEHVGSNRFDLVARRVHFLDGRSRVSTTEVHLDLSMDVGDRRYVVHTVNAASQLVRLRNPDDTVDMRPDATGTGLQAALADLGADTSTFVSLANGTDGVVPTLDQIGAALPTLDLSTLAHVNVLCLPIMSTTDVGYDRLVATASAFCAARRAFLIVDPFLVADTVDEILRFDTSAGGPNNAIYVPHLVIEDPLAENSPRLVAPSGTVAGIYARTDAERGVWKAPAGTEARIRGARIAGPRLTDADRDELNRLGINVLRSLPGSGDVVWGARTGDGADLRASEWKYVSVRRTALYIEESLAQGLQWVVFEPNDEPLWSRIRRNVGDFMQVLFREGAFAGSRPEEAYFVRCDRTTSSQDDIDNGIVNVEVGFAPLKPSEFVVIRLGQKTAT